MRTTSFADVPLKLPEGAPRQYDTFPARYVSQYIEDYVRDHVYSGKTLFERIWLETDVMSARKTSGGWTLHLEGSECRSIRCSKLAFASGQTSRPNLPIWPRHPDWEAPILHHKDFGANYQALVSPGSPHKHITVLGGGKSAADMVYAVLRANPSLQVNWIIRNAGEGPGYFMHAAPKGKYRNAAEPMLSQNATQMNPSGFVNLVGDFRYLHQSETGRETIVGRVAQADQNSKAWANYRERKDALLEFHRLEPSAS